MLLAVEFFDAVASLVVLTEAVLLLLSVKVGAILPRRSGLDVGASVINFALENVDCTRNGEGISETTATGTRRRVGSLARTFVNSVGHDIEGFGFGDGRHCKEKFSARDERKREQRLAVVAVVGGDSGQKRASLRVDRMRRASQGSHGGFIYGLGTALGRRDFAW